ncbi:MAG: thioredoxin domain-containing protein [Magnetovibrio sp.]|nr:thioredoxin domain-containing protein [Magnetovibrio sp.]
MRRFLAVLAAAVWLTAAPASAETPADNQLGAEASPYLRMHATDPVHWRPWTEAALAEARRAGKPILLSIGYSACHWCHVMQRESFADAETAAAINARFFPILIDREERPDLDAQFQATAVLLDLPTGWPLTVFLTPEAETFFSGTYFPDEARHGMPGFRDVLDQVARTFAEDPEGVGENAALIKATLAQVHRPRPGEITAAHLALASAGFMEEADTLAGGFGGAAKFPQWVALAFLWRHHLRTGSAPAGEHVRLSLTEMVRGGLADHAGGGFFRYTVDPQWRVPHFEKMLDVNGGLLRLMTQVWRETRDPELARAVAETVTFLDRDMRLPGGAFAASLDADSRDADGAEREGAYYRWRRGELSAALASGTEAFLEAYDIAPIAGPPGSEEDDPDWGHLVRPAALDILRRKRAGRPPPHRDEKVLADWNGQAIAALAEAGLAFGEAGWIAAAQAAFGDARRALSGPTGRLHQSAVGARVGSVATLGGVTAMADAAVSLFEATGQPDYLAQALTWAAAIERHHGDAEAPGFFDSAADAEATPFRMKSAIDDPNPSGNARAALVAARLYYHTGRARWREMAAATLRAHGRAVGRPQLGFAGLLLAADTLAQALQVVIIGARGEAGTERLLAGVMRRSLPAQVLQVVAPGTVLPEGHPARYKEQIDGRATAYICRGAICSLPVTEAGPLDETLTAMRRR